MCESTMGDGCANGGGTDIIFLSPPLYPHDQPAHLGGDFCWKSARRGVRESERISRTGLFSASPAVRVSRGKEGEGRTQGRQELGLNILPFHVPCAHMRFGIQDAWCRDSVEKGGGGSIVLAFCITKPCYCFANPLAVYFYHYFIDVGVLEAGERTKLKGEVSAVYIIPNLCQR
ncbi:hypothetical protein BD410DRAFT_520777 [Rickenella mellea]|uniref:Uncharacterized protein n=1 Tax=Rickenella mellea TaxID=50990 RepID=A0A4Y7QGW2_9AGAM|nr:hypothetical protein BD410DRAFT_520777 [Rickenella mellea]